MGQNMEQVSESAKREEYYRAALDFIDSTLTTSSPLAVVLNAAEQRRNELTVVSGDDVREELNALAEAVLYIQHQQPPGGQQDYEAAQEAERDTPVEDDDQTTSATEEGDYPLFSLGASVQAAEQEQISVEAIADAVIAEQDDPPIAGQPETDTSPALTEPETLTAPAVMPVSAPASMPAAEPTPVVAQQAELKRKAADVVPSVTTSSPRNPRRPSLSEVMHQANREAAASVKQVQPLALGFKPQPREQSTPLPEAQAWPQVIGQALLLWQAWLAGFAGWVVVHLFIWPRPGVGYETGWLGVAGYIALGIVVAAISGATCWRYRVRTRCLALLVNLSALFFAVDLFAWWSAARRVAGVIPPPLTHWLLLVALWVIALWLARRHDAEAKKRDKRR